MKQIKSTDFPEDYKSWGSISPGGDLAGTYMHLSGSIMSFERGDRDVAIGWPQHTTVCTPEELEAVAVLLLLKDDEYLPGVGIRITSDLVVLDKAVTGGRDGENS
jgi:hypothetical protein